MLMAGNQIRTTTMMTTSLTRAMLSSAKSLAPTLALSSLLASTCRGALLFRRLRMELRARRLWATFRLPPPLARMVYHRALRLQRRAPLLKAFCGRSRMALLLLALLLRINRGVTQSLLRLLALILLLLFFRLPLLITLRWLPALLLQPPVLLLQLRLLRTLFITLLPQLLALPLKINLRPLRPARPPLILTAKALRTKKDLRQRLPPGATRYQPVLLRPPALLPQANHNLLQTPSRLLTLTVATLRSKKVLRRALLRRVRSYRLAVLRLLALPLQTHRRRLQVVLQLLNLPVEARRTKKGPPLRALLVKAKCHQ